MTATNRMAPVHPGEVLREELDEIGLSATGLARALDVPPNRVTAILNGQRGVSADTALRLGRYFDTTSQFWLNLQQTYELRRAEVSRKAEIHERVRSRATESIREAARSAQAISEQSAASKAALGEVLRRQSTLAENLSAFERSLQGYGQQTRAWGALGGPIHELRSLGVLDGALRDHLTSTRHWLDDYERRFQAPGWAELERLATGATASLEAIKTTLESLREPWFDVADELGSFGRLVDLQGLGDHLAGQSGFLETVAAGVRESLGDWRDQITWPDRLWTSFDARAEFYADLGFKRHLTDLPAPAFHEMTTVTGVCSAPPSLARAYGSPVPCAEDTDDETGFRRTNEAHDWLQRLESQLRRFIDRQMTKVFGEDWPRRQLPRNMHEKWLEKKRKAERDCSSAERPLIAYADFVDYSLIISKRDNWRVFRRFFLRPENVRESFQRLHPIRLDTMHARPVSQDDQLLLYVETRRLSRSMLTDVHEKPTARR